MDQTGIVHVVGAGIAGLSAALACTRRGRRVVIHEARGQAGGRLHSWHDRDLGCVVDNGIHWVFSGQEAVWDYLREIGAADRFCGPAEAGFDFVDLHSGARWRLRPNGGILPWWVLTPGRNVPGSGLADLISFLRMAVAGEGRCVADCVDRASASYRRFWLPFTIAALNTPPEAASARELSRVLRIMLSKGEAGLRLRFPVLSLADSFIEPAVKELLHRGAEMRWGARLRSMSFSAGEASELVFEGETLPLGPRDRVVAALAPNELSAVLPGLDPPRETSAIVTVHFNVSLPVEENTDAVCLLDSRPLWLQRRNDIVSVTIGAANDLAGETSEKVAAGIWPVVSSYLSGKRQETPPARVIKERRGVFSHTPENIARRALVSTRWANVFIAGDWVRTGVSATIESAILAGESAARAALEEAAR